MTTHTKQLVYKGWSITRWFYRLISSDFRLIDKLIRISTGVIDFELDSSEEISTCSLRMQNGDIVYLYPYGISYTHDNTRELDIIHRGGIWHILCEYEIFDVDAKKRRKTILKNLGI